MPNLIIKNVPVFLRENQTTMNFVIQKDIRLWIEEQAKRNRLSASAVVRHILESAHEQKNLKFEKQDD